MSEQLSMLWRSAQESLTPLSHSDQNRAKKGAAPKVRMPQHGAKPFQLGTYPYQKLCKPSCLGPLSLKNRMIAWADGRIFDRPTARDDQKSGSSIAGRCRDKMDRQRITDMAIERAAGGAAALVLGPIDLMADDWSSELAYWKTLEQKIAAFSVEVIWTFHWGADHLQFWALSSYLKRLSHRLESLKTLNMSAIYLDWGDIDWAGPGLERTLRATFQEWIPRQLNTSLRFNRSAPLYTQEGVLLKQQERHVANVEEDHIDSREEQDGQLLKGKVHASEDNRFQEEVSEACQQAGKTDESGLAEDESCSGLIEDQVQSVSDEQDQNAPSQARPHSSILLSGVGGLEEEAALPAEDQTDRFAETSMKAKADRSVAADVSDAVGRAQFGTALGEDTWDYLAERERARRGGDLSVLLAWSRYERLHMRRREGRQARIQFLKWLQSAFAEPVSILLRFPTQKWTEQSGSAEELQAWANLGVMALLPSLGGPLSSVMEANAAYLSRDYGVTACESLRRFLHQKGFADIQVMFAFHTMEPQRMDQGMRQEKWDLVLLNEVLAADPSWPSRAFAGRVSEIEPLLPRQDLLGLDLSQTTYPRLDLRAVPQTVRPLRVAVVGGGPAGVSAALTACQAGHQVWLFHSGMNVCSRLRRRVALGGQNQASAWLAYVDEQVYRQQQTGRLELQLNCLATRTMLLDAKFDRIILACGSESRPSHPALMEQGYSLSQVLEDPSLLDEAEHILAWDWNEPELELFRVLQSKPNRLWTFLWTGRPSEWDWDPQLKRFWQMELALSGARMAADLKMIHVDAQQVRIAQISDPRQVTRSVFEPVVKTRSGNINAAYLETLIDFDVLVYGEERHANTRLYQELLQDWAAPSIHPIAALRSLTSVGAAVDAGRRLVLALDRYDV